MFALTAIPVKHCYTKLILNWLQENRVFGEDFYWDSFGVIEYINFRCYKCHSVKENGKKE